MKSDDVGNFLSRWSRRKLGKEEPAPEPPAPVWTPELPAADPLAHLRAPDTAPEAATESSAASPPLPPVESLTPESDFTPFMRPDVAPALKQAAMKQLFKDPHFNVMDGLDTYIDDYSIADPIPDEMLKKMYQSRQLLFTDEEKAAADAADAADVAEAAQAAQVAEAAEAAELALAPQPEAAEAALLSAEDAVRELEAAALQERQEKT